MPEFDHVTAPQSDETRAALMGTAPEPTEPAPADPGVEQPTSPGAIVRFRIPADDNTPNVEWVDLKDPDLLRARDRKAVMGKITGSMSAGSGAVAITDGVVAMLVVGWSLPYPIPAIRLESLGDLTLPQENAIQSHPLVIRGARLVQGEVNPLDASGKKDPESPTEPSAG